MHKIFNQFRSEESIFIDEPKQFSRIKVPLYKISKKEFYILLVSLLNSATFYTQKSLLEVNPILMIKFFNKLDSRIFLSIETQEYNLFLSSFQIFTCFVSFSVHFLLSSLYIRVFCLAFCTHFLFRQLWTPFYCFGFFLRVHKIKSISFYEPQGEFETIEWGNPKHILYLNSQIIFYRNTRRIRAELDKNTGRMQNSLRILFKNLVCNGAFKVY